MLSVFMICDKVEIGVSDKPSLRLQEIMPTKSSMTTLQESKCMRRLSAQHYRSQDDSKARDRLSLKLERSEPSTDLT